MVRHGERIHVGTSGWSYKHWKGPFYPEDLPGTRFLDFYAQRFATVEINGSFYRLPEVTTLEHWRDAVPEGFCFAAKGSRYITHMKKLKEPGKTLPPFLDHMATLGEKLGPILFQLPPNWGFQPERLREFLEALPGGFRYTMEFRNADWYDERAYELLRRHNVAFCIYDLDGTLSPETVTADFVYVRLHGPDGPYQGQYDDQTLAGWAGALAAWADSGREAYCYFDNDERGYAAQDALRLQQMVRGG